MSERYDLIFSFKNQLSISVLDFLKANNLLQNIKFFEIEKIQNSQLWINKYKNLVSVIPTLIDYKNKKIIGGENIIFYFNLIVKQKTNIQNDINTNQKQDNNHSNNIKPFINLEMNSISSLYGFND